MTPPFYAPLPARAMGDKTLTAEELRILMAIATHDRLGANGTGCYASHPRLAELVGCHEKSLSRSLRHLVDKGYIIVGPSPLSRRQRVYRVVYRDFDKQYFAASGKANGNRSATKKVTMAVTDKERNGSSVVTMGDAIGSTLTPVVRVIGNSPSRKSEINQSDDDDNIFSETAINSVETGTNPAEAVLGGRSESWNSAKSVASMLGRIDRDIRLAKMTPGQIERWRGWIDHHFSGDKASSGSESQWALRLRAELDRLVSTRASEIGHHQTA